MAPSIDTGFETIMAVGSIPAAAGEILIVIYFFACDVGSAT